MSTPTERHSPDKPWAGMSPAQREFQGAPCAAHGAVSGRGSAWIPWQQAVDSCSWPQVPSVPPHLRKAPSAQHLKRAPWQPATVSLLKTGVSSPW